MRPLYRYMRLSEFALLGYVILGGVIVPEAGFFPASVLNQSLLYETIGIPIYIFRATCGLVLAYSIIRAGETFQQQTEHIIEEAHDASLLLDDRERISRELHDNTIQSIYAAGLMLESASYAIDDSPRQAKTMLARAMDDLNAIIQDLRRYIFDLRAYGDDLKTSPLAESLEKMLEDLRINTLLSVDMSVDGEDEGLLSAQEKEHVLRIAREALTNAAKHSHAVNVAIRLQWGPDEMRLRIADDGVGMNGSPEGGANFNNSGHGLRNMRERAALLGGALRISGQKGRGVVLDLEVPYKEVPP
jgi:signal transduction histidine kinase